jgi:hypothetical protein
MAYYANLNRTISNENDLPTISTALESVRAYQWEVIFSADNEGDSPLTLAAKQVNGIGMQVEDIEVNRVNDKVYYPGRPSVDELRVTFDNISNIEMTRVLYTIFSEDTYDPVTGSFQSLGGGGTGGTFGKLPITLRQLNPDMTILNEIHLLGAYPKKWTPAEYNYATNDFHTIEVTFRYDFIIHSV